MKNNLPIVTVKSKTDGLEAIKLTEGAFEGIIYTYGKVEFEEDEENDTVRLKFDYEIHDYNNKTITDKAPFETYIGDILQELIHKGIEENSLTYTGGVDEDRTKDSK